jgi:hypothetical protein
MYQLILLKNKKAQTAIEFVVLIGGLMLFLSVFILMIQEGISDKLTEKQNLLLKDTAFTIQEEINLASSATDGYTREFIVPEKIGERDYNLTIVENSIYLKTIDNKNSLALPIPPITGNIIKGSNMIKKVNGSLIIN